MLLPNSKLITKPDGLSIFDWRQAWLNLRVGRFTASKAHKMTSTSTAKKNGALTWENYVIDTVQEMVEGRVEGYENETMTNGNIFEDDAVDIFMEKNNKLLQRLTFLQIGDHVGISADGIDIDGEFGVEVKSPHFKGYVNYCRAIKEGQEFFAKTFKDHYAQMQMAMWGFGFEYYYFIAYYSPEYKKEKRLGSKGHYRQMIIKRDDKFIKLLEQRVEMAIKYKQELLQMVGIL